MQLFPNCEDKSTTKIKVIGIGGGGCNSINRLIEEGINGVEFIAMDTDPIIICQSKASKSMRLIEKDRKGLDGGADPQRAEFAAENSATEISRLICDAFLIIIISSFGGGTGSGAAPVVARIAKQTGALIISIVTYPFTFENPQRLRMATEGIIKIKNYVDTLIILNNDRLIKNYNNTSLCEALKGVDEIVFQYVKNILEFFVNPA